MNAICLGMFVLEISLCATAIILIRLAFGKFVGPKICRLLWAVLIVRCLVPVNYELRILNYELPPLLAGTPRSALEQERAGEGGPIAPAPTGQNVDNPRPAKNTEPGVSDTTSSLSPNGASQNWASHAPSGLLYYEGPQPPAEAGGYRHFALPGQEIASDETCPTQEQGRAGDVDVAMVSIPWAPILWPLWATGTLLLLAVVLHRNRSFSRRALRNPGAVSKELQILFQESTRQLSLRRLPQLVVSRHVESPCVMGILRPKVLIPKELAQDAADDPEMLRHVLLHELAHLKQGDLWFSWCWTLVLAIHWYNPLLWWACRKITHDCEAACDANVLELLPPLQRSSYGYSLLKISDRLRSTAPSVPGMSAIIEKTTNLERRVNMINHYKKPTLLRTLAGGVMLLALCTISMTTLAYKEAVPVERAEESTATGRAGEGENALNVTPLLTNMEQATYLEGGDNVEIRFESQPIPKSPHKLRTGDMIQIETSGTPQDEPIGGQYYVLPEGEIFLGVNYGKLYVRGLSVTEMENALLELLKKRLANPTVIAVLRETNLFENPQPVLKSSYKLRTGDMIRIVVSGTPQDAPINDLYAVLPEGEIFLGINYGKFYVRGLSVAEMENALLEHLKQRLKNPRVTAVLEGTSPFPSSPVDENSTSEPMIRIAELQLKLAKAEAAKTIELEYAQAALVVVLAEVERNRALNNQTPNTVSEQLVLETNLKRVLALKQYEKAVYDFEVLKPLEVKLKEEELEHLKAQIAVNRGPAHPGNDVTIARKQLATAEVMLELAKAKEQETSDLEYAKAALVVVLAEVERYQKQNEETPGTISGAVLMEANLRVTQARNTYEKLVYDLEVIRPTERKIKEQELEIAKKRLEYWEGVVAQ